MEPTGVPISIAIIAISFFIVFLVLGIIISAILLKKMRENVINYSILQESVKDLREDCRRLREEVEWLSEQVFRSKRDIYTDAQVKDDILKLLNDFQDKPSYNFEYIYNEALKLRDQGFKASIKLEKETYSSYTEKTPNPNFSANQAFDGYEGDWCDNPAYIETTSQVVDEPERLIVVRGDKY